MKKISLLLTALLLAMFVTGCSDNSDSAAPSENTNSGISATTESSEAEEGSEDPEVSGTVAEIDALYQYDLDEKGGSKNIISGNAYTTNRKTLSSIPDDGVCFTDNVEASADSDTGFVEWLAFTGRDEIEITVDLGGLKKNLVGFSVNVLYASSSGQGIPRTVDFYVSDDGENYVKAATSYRYGESLGNSNLVYCHKAMLQKGIDAAFVKIRISDMLTNLTFVDYFQAYQYTDPDQEGETEVDYYQNEPLPTVTPSYWENTETDYQTEQNLLQGLPQRIYLGAPLPAELKTDYYNAPVSSKLLTDGRRGGNSYGDNQYFHMTRGFVREIVYDLGHLSGLSSAVVGVNQTTSVAVVFPQNIRILLSEDGENWQSVAYKAADALPAIDNARTDVTLDFGNIYEARFVKFTFTLTAHCWIDELEVFGTKQVPENAKKIVPDTEDKTESGYPSPDVLGGSENILLAYNYKVENRPIGEMTKEGLLPYVGYFNTEGKLTDYFFDTYLFLPCSTTCPSGGVLWNNPENPSVMTDWLDYEEDLFKEERNVNALDAAVGEIKNQLNDADYRAKVYLSIFNAPITMKNFGDVDGDGVSEDCSIAENRIKIAKWWIDKNLARFQAGNYTNLDFKGFYYYDEGITSTSESDRKLLKFVVDYIHSLGYYIIWIPYYQASGFTEWENVGFDMANMQPNYMFTESATEQVLYDNAMLTKMLGMGVEIEISGKVFSSAEYYDRYMAYLRVGVEKGYMNSIKMYYQDAGPGVFYEAFQSENPKFRAIYDLTYQYVKGTLTVAGIKLSTTTLEGKKNTSLKGTFTLEDATTPTSATIFRAPKYGKLAISANGADYEYVPMNGFTGKDAFEISVSNGLISQTFTIDVNVAE